MEYKGWTGKIILYVGNISMRVDHALLRYIAENNADKLLVIVGPKEGEDYKKQELESYSNIVFTGAKKYKELPQYVKYSDCAIIPFLKNKMTKSIYPLKINEYLAAGKPVVTTDFSDDIVDFANVVYIAPDYKGFADAINLAIKEDSPERTTERVEFASKNTWENRADLFWEFVESSLRDKGVVIS
jgi:glycosyltransferase involved in cell wall biosynthesis